MDLEISISDQKKHVKCSKSRVSHSKDGRRKVQSDVLKRPEDIDDISVKTLRKSRKEKKSSSKVSKTKRRKEEKYATLESAHMVKKKIWRGNVSSLDENIRITKLSEILLPESIAREKDLGKFWTTRSRGVSKKSWLPTKKDSVESTTISSNGLSQNTPMGQSWFSLQRKMKKKTNSSKTSWPSSPLSQANYTGDEITKFSEESVKLKTMKFRIYPETVTTKSSKFDMTKSSFNMTKSSKFDQKEAIDLMFQQSRWYYNLLIKIVYLELYLEETKSFTKWKYSYIEIRNLLKKYSYIEKKRSSKIKDKYLVPSNGYLTFPTPKWWLDEDGKTTVHNRIPRGAAKKLSQNLNSALSNLKAGNIKSFVLRPIDKKSNNFVLFEDKQYPAFIKKIPSVYQYRGVKVNGVCPKMRISYRDIQSTRGMELYYEYETKKYYILAPVEVDYFPPGDRRGEKMKVFTEEVVALDPGMRKFLVGYNPEGSIDTIGKGAAETLFQSLRKIDVMEYDNKKTRKKWRRVKGRISDMHWKVAKFLTDEYDTILLPDFRVSGMINRGKTLCKKVRRLLSMLSFYKFREKLEFKCKEKGKRLFIVSEAYTSKTCSGCGNIQNIGSSEVYNCPCCDLHLDRDINGAKNIFLRNFDGFC